MTSACSQSVAVQLSRSARRDSRARRARLHQRCRHLTEAPSCETLCARHVLALSFNSRPRDPSLSHTRPWRLGNDIALDSAFPVCRARTSQGNDDKDGQQALRTEFVWSRTEGFLKRANRWFANFARAIFRSCARPLSSLARVGPTPPLDFSSSFLATHSDCLHARLRYELDSLPARYSDQLHTRHGVHRSHRCAA